VISAPPVFHLPSSIVSVVPVVAEPKIVGRPLLTGFVAAPNLAKDRVTEFAAKKEPFPSAFAVMVHVPICFLVTFVPETVQTAVVLDEKLTGNPELVEAVSSKVLSDAPT